MTLRFATGLAIEFLLLALTLSACTSEETVWERHPSSTGSLCNRQTLGEATLDNSPLAKFNDKRIDNIRPLLQAQVDQLKTRVAEGSLIQDRLDILQHQLKRISSPHIRISEEPVEVSFKLSRALEAYVKDLTIDEQAHTLSGKDEKTLKYVKESIEPHLSEVPYWLPEFCQGLNGQEPTESFKKL